MTEFTREFIEFHKLCLEQYIGTEEFVWSTELALDTLNEIERLQARVQELEEALAKIANYESMRFKLSPYEYGLLEQIVGIVEHALKGDK